MGLGNRREPLPLRLTEHEEKKPPTKHEIYFSIPYKDEKKSTHLNVLE
jgi:hypothetical protein